MPTELGQALTSSTDGAVSFTDANDGTANVVMPDIRTTNGVIHVIDAVLIPSL